MSFHHTNPRNPDPNNPIESDKLITADMIIETFKTSVIDEILKGAYHAQNIPTCRYDGKVYQCVPSDQLGSSDYFEKKNNIWKDLYVSGNIVAALVGITSMFTNIGSFAWALYVKNVNYPTESGVTNGTFKVSELSGKCIFNKDKYTRTNIPESSVINNGIRAGEQINAKNLVTLINSCLKAWSKASRPNYENSVTITNTCHDNCHDKCHDNCNCHDECHNQCHDECHTDCHNDCHTEECHTDCYTDCHGPCYSKTCHTDCYSCYTCHCDGCACYSGMSR